MPSSALIRYTVVFGYLAIKIVLLILKLNAEPPLEAEYMYATYGELGLGLLLGVLALARLRVPTILFGGYLLLCGVFGLVAGGICLVGGLMESGGSATGLLNLLLALVIGALFAWGGYLLIRLGVREPNDHSACRAQDEPDEKQG